MGKVKKERSFKHKKPYDRPDSDMKIDISEIQEQAKIQPIQQEPPQEEERAEQEADDEVEMKVAKATTRGAILQRHKLELKELRKKIDEMKTQRLKLSKRVAGQKQDRKEVSRNIKALENELKEKHKKELEEFDAREKAVKELASLPPIKFDFTFKYAVVETKKF
eukprot:TRINITY_DN22986_c0_g1_i1.p1 TRINITY_DN22986_c0_g1~~TRINITY_DN22986_c0_g1_i1.p1  ORF type:complete len:165 (-),score=37.46 TRINITY_DN22986_c0_g1_i1:39-533(-)